jgi:hypothetical protein
LGRGKALSATTIPESFLEHRQSFTSPWIDRWTVPNPFVSALHQLLKELGVEMADFSFNKEASSLGDVFLNIALRKLDAAVKIGLDFVTFSAANPDWAEASRLISTFEQVARVVCGMVEATPASQQSTLALHVRSDTVDVAAATAALVRKDMVGEAAFYGVSLHRSAGTVIIDKSVKYERAAFVRLQRRFVGEDLFPYIAAKLYEDEVFAFRLLGLMDERGVSR